MLIPTEQALIGFEPEEEKLELFEKPVNPVVVPRNVAELAAQVAGVDVSQLEMPFTNRLSRSHEMLHLHGASAVLSDIAKQERLDRTGTLRLNAEAAAKRGDAVSLETAARMLADAERMQAEPSNVEGHKAVATRHLEMKGLEYAASRYKNLDQFNETLEREADAMSLRNLVGHKSAELEGQTSVWDKIGFFFSQLIPFATDYQANRAISGITGIDRYFDTDAAVNDFRQFFLGLSNEERVEVMTQLAKQEVGVFGDNKAANIELLRKIAELTKVDANVDIVFNTLGIADVAAISKGLAMLVRRGTPVRAITEVAGEKAAADVAATDLLNGTKMGGLNEPELAAHALAMGRNPMDVDPAAFSGLSAPMQEKLRADYDALLNATRDRLISSGLTSDEIKQGIADIKARYTVGTNPTIHSVTFGEGNELGQKMTVMWQGPDGKAFSSKEAAEAWAKAEGKNNYTVVPKNTADFSPELQSATPTGATLNTTTSGNVLLGADADRVDSLLVRSKQSYIGDPMGEQLIDIFRDASRAGVDHVPATTILKTIAAQSADEDYRFIADHLLRTKVNWEKVGVELHYGLGQANGTYNLVSDRVRVSLSAAGDAEVALHELIHAHNAQVITLAAGSRRFADLALNNSQKVAAKQVIDLHKRLKVWHSKALMKEKEKFGSLADPDGGGLGDLSSNWRLKYALSRPAELITHAMVNPAVRDVLKKVKLSELGYTTNESVWSKLWDSFKSILGLRANDTALAKLLQAQEAMAESITEVSRTAITKLYKANIIDDTALEAIILGGDAGVFASKKGSKPMSIGKAIDKEIAKEEKKLVKAPEGEREAIIQRIKELRESKTPTAPKAPPPTAPREEWLVKEQRVDPISIENVGKFSDEDIRSMPWLAIDPKHAASELALEERVIGVHAEAKTRRDLVKFLTPYFDKLDNAGKARVRSVLSEGDSYSNAGGQYGKEFTYSELRGKGLSEEEAAAYFAVRQVRMVSYHLRNGEMVRSLRAEGMREVTFLGTGQKQAGKVLEQSDAGQALGKIIYDATTQRPYLVDSNTIEESYKAGKRIVRMKQPVPFHGKHYSHVLIDESTASIRDIDAALHYRPGEFSRIYTDQYFITVRKMATVDGQTQEITETVRTAASTREAQEYVEAHRKAIQLMFDAQAGKVPGNINEKLEQLVGRYTDIPELRTRFDAGELDGYVSMDFHYTRNREEFLNGSISEAMTNGRLFNSKRSDKLFSVDRDRVNTLDVFESLEAEITNISRVVNVSMWRDNMIQRWMNTFGHMLPNRTGNNVSDFFSAAGAEFTRGTPEAQFAERTHKYIMRQLGVKTQEEKYYEGLTRTMTEKMFKGNEGIESLGAKIRTMSWLGFIRNVNFNLNLGMFNPAQLIVQANGAVTAAILSPLHGLKAANTFPLLRMALMSDNPDVWRRLARVEKVKNLGLSDEGEFVSLVQAIRKAGILDNVRSTALWNLEDGALDVFAGYPRRVTKSHTFFFNRGEEFSRVVSFDVARREWIQRNPGQAWNTDEALKQIVVRMDDLTQNMTKANLARFQEGALSIPLQFAQYNIKLGANVLSAFLTKGTGRGFTKTEATQLLIGHVILYGAYGNGLVALMDEVLGQETKDALPVAAKEMMAQGLVSWLFDQMAEATTGEGAKVAFGSRLGSFDYYQRIGEAIFTDPKNVYEALLGPTLSSAKRLGVFGEVAQLWWKDPELSGQDVLEGLSRIGTEQVASLRNAAKAYLYLQHQGLMLDRQGVALGKLNNNELLMQALGFQPTVAVDLNALIKTKQDHNEALDDIAKLIFRTQRDIITAVKNGDMKRAEEHKKTLQALWPQNAGDFMEVQKRVRDRLFPYETEMQRLLGEYIWKGQTYNQPVVVTEQPKAK